MNVKTIPELQLGEVGYHTTAHAPGAFANGSRVRKSTFHQGDTHPVGSFATVLGSIGPIDHGRGREYGYFVRWDLMPETAVFVRGSKLELVARPVS